jgi:hypothetical protein
MTQLTKDAMQLFARQHGVATGAQLSAVGVSRRSRHSLVEAGLMEIQYERVFRITSAALTLPARCAALCLAYPTGFVTGPTGGRLMPLRRMGLDRRLHFSIPHGTHVGPFEDVHLRQTTRIEAVDRVLRKDGIRLASPPRLAFDLASDLDMDDLASVVEQLISSKACTMATLVATARRLAHPARPGSWKFVETLRSRGVGPSQHSHVEVILARSLRDRGVPVQTQVQPLALRAGRSIRLDLAVPEIRWGIEIDVHPDHLLLEGTTRDKRRDRRCHEVGWQVERVTPLDLVDIDGLFDELVRLYQARCALLGRRVA